MLKSLDPLTVSFKGNCVQRFHSNSEFVQSSSDGSQAEVFHILEYQVVLYKSGLNFSEFYCICSNDPAYNCMLLVFIKLLYSSPRARKSLCPLEEQSLYIFVFVAAGSQPLLWYITTTIMALVKCIYYLLVCHKIWIMEATVDCLRLGWTLSPASLSDKP